VILRNFYSKYFSNKKYYFLHLPEVKKCKTNIRKTTKVAYFNAFQKVLERLFFVSEIIFSTNNDTSTELEIVYANIRV
jgi:hypothetical protein